MRKRRKSGKRGGGQRQTRHPSLAHALKVGGYRTYPSRNQRHGIICELKQRDPSTYEPVHWWQLGEFQILEGLESGDEKALDRGAAALLRGIEAGSIQCKESLAWLLCFKREDEVARFYLDQLIDDCPESDEVWSLRGWVCLGMGEREEAIRCLNTAEQIYPDPRIRDVLESLGAGVEADKIRCQIVLCKFAESHKEPGIHGSPGAAQANRKMGLIYGLKKNPGSPNAAGTLASFLMENKEYKEAELVLREALVRNPDNTELRFLTLKVHETYNDGKRLSERSLAQIRKILEVDPNHVDAGAELAFYHMSRHEHPQAMELIDRLIPAAETDESDGGYQLANLLHLKAWYVRDHECNGEKAHKLWQRSVKLVPSGAAYTHMILNLMRMDEAGEARRIFSEARRKGVRVLAGEQVSKAIQYLRQDKASPTEMMERALMVSDVAGGHAGRHLLRRAWASRGSVAEQARDGFARRLVELAAVHRDAELILEVFASGWIKIADRDPIRSYQALAYAEQGDKVKAALLAREIEPRDFTTVNLLQAVDCHTGDIEMILRHAGAAARIVKDDKRIDQQGKLGSLQLALSTSVWYARPQDLEPIARTYESLEKATRKTASGRALGAMIAFMQGNVSKAAKGFIAALWDGDRIRMPEELFGLAEEEDGHIRLMKEDDTDSFAHRLAALCLWQARRGERLQRLIERMREWRCGQEPFWAAMEVESQLATGDVEAAAAVRHDHPEQIVWQLAQARIALSRGDQKRFDACMKPVLEVERGRIEAHHPLGLASAVARALAAERELSNNDIVGAQRHVERALELSTTSAFVWSMQDHCLTVRGDATLRLARLMEALTYLPGEPSLVSALVESLVSAGENEQARQALNEQRRALGARGEQVVGYRLGEWIAVDQLSQLRGEGDEWAWAQEQPEPVRSWLQGAQIALGRGDELAAAYGLYIGKTAEHLLLKRVLEPFREAVGDVGGQVFEQYPDMSRFLAGGYAPSIGVVARLFESASHSMRPSEDRAVTEFRRSINRGLFGNPTALQSAQFIQEIKALGQMRNSTAHLGAHSIDETLWATRCVVDNGEPGLLFSELYEPVEVAPAAETG